MTTGTAIVLALVVVLAVASLVVRALRPRLERRTLGELVFAHNLITGDVRRLETSDGTTDRSVA